VAAIWRLSRLLSTLVQQLWSGVFRQPPGGEVLPTCMSPAGLSTAVADPAIGLSRDLMSTERETSDEEETRC